jgi:hypothetical protein
VERDSLEDKNIDERTILKQIFGKQVAVVWSELGWQENWSSFVHET